MRKLLIFLLIPFLLFAVTVDDLQDANTMTTHNQCAVVTGGIIENCTDYDGNADWMDCPDNNNLDFNTCDFTIQAWIYLDEGNNKWVLMKKGQVSDAYINYGLMVAPALKPVLKIGPTGFNSGYVITTGAWFHVVVAFHYNPGGNSTAHFYVNNNKSSILKTVTPTANNYDLVIGKHMSTETPSDYEWDGKIDEIGIWNRTLNDAEAASLYNGGSALAYGSFSAGLLNGLVSYWSHDPEAPSGAGQIIKTVISR